MILLDEPELGLHLCAITLLAALVEQASVETQVVMATQSAPLLDHFRPEDVRRGTGTVAGGVKPRPRAQRGGVKPWASACREIARRLHEDAGQIATTMVDYYGMPRTGSGAWPGRAAAATLPFPERARSVEEALSASVSTAMSADFDTSRFVPYVMMHEFEALLFSHCAKFGRGIARVDLSDKFQRIRDAFRSPEEIDDSPETAPSSGWNSSCPGTRSRSMDSSGRRKIGLEAMRRECPHFREWLVRLERLAGRGT